MDSKSSSILPPDVPNSALAALLGTRHAAPASAMYQPKKVLEVPSHFFLGNTAEEATQRGNNWYKWKFYVSRDEYKLTSVIDFVDRVHVTLPLGYQKQGPIDFDLTADDDGALIMERFGYGEASFKVVVTFKDPKRAPIETTYNLSYAKSIQGVLTATPAIGSATATAAAPAAAAAAAAPAAASS